MRVLMIGAHQDDNELRCGGLAHKYAKMGYEVRFLSMCNGCGGHHIMSPEETVVRRGKESQAVAALLGITYDVWDIDDCNLVADLPTRKRLIRYIREFSPNLIISHRPNDYHADHRAAAQLVLDASYLLTVPHECPEIPAMRSMPVIMYMEDRFKFPEFVPSVVLDMDDEIETKLEIMHLNASQVYEWIPYTRGEEAPKEEEARRLFLRGMDITPETTDEQIMAATRGYAVRFAKTAIRFRTELIERYGLERGSRIRYAECFELCDYGKVLTKDLQEKLFPF